jgi:hypothetical protein
MCCCSLSFFLSQAARRLARITRLQPPKPPFQQSFVIMRRPGFAVTCCMSLMVGVYIGVNLSFVNTYHDSLNEQHAASLHRPPGSAQRQLEVLQVRVERSKREASQAMDHVLRLEMALQECQQRQPPPNETIVQKSSSQSSISSNNSSRSRSSSNNSNNNMEHPICQLLPVPTPSASGLWHNYIMNVLQATRLPNDRRFKFHDFTAELLQIISPRLPRSVKTVPQEWKSLEYAMTIGWKRYQYLQERRQQQPQNPKLVTHPPPRPLKVLVMGGSLLVGTNCRQVFSELQLGSQMGLPKRDCTWSNRLGKFLNMVFGVEFDSKTLQPIRMDSHNGYLFDVTKVAMGGTNTATGSVILEYDLIPENARNPDIIINAYATNDMHILTILEAQSQNSTLRDKVFEMTQQFVRDVMGMSSSSSSTSCNEDEDNGGQSPKPPPLLLHMDDYLGNEQRKIWETTELSQGAQVLANYYGFASLSYADVVRDVVYGDTYESWFSANWWGDSAKNPTFAREIHPGMGMHIAATWVVAYNLLNLVTTYCSIPLLPEDSANISTYYDGAMGLPALRHDVAQPRGKPKPRPLGLPPLLTQELLLEDVTQLWQQDSLKRQSKVAAALMTTTAATTCDGKAATTTKCPFSWVSGLSLQQNNKTWMPAPGKDGNWVTTVEKWVLFPPNPRTIASS